MHVDAKGTVSQAIEFASPPPGLYRLMGTLNDSLRKDMILGYEPEKIVSPLTREADCEEFRKKRRQELAAVVPEYRIAKSDRSTDSIDVYLVTMQSYGHVRVRGWYTVPSKPGPHSAILSLPGYTSTMWPYVNRTNVATFALNRRGHGNSKDDVAPKGQEYMFIGSDPKRTSMPAPIWIVCGLSIFSCPGPRLTLLALAWKGGWVGYLATEDWARENCPTLIARYPGLTFAGVNRLLSCFDTMNMAEWVICPVLMSVGLQDDVCPPRISFAPYNAVRNR